MNLSWKNIDGVYCLVFSAKATGDIDTDENVYFSYVFTEFVHYFQTKGNLELAGKFLKLVDLFVNAKPNDDGEYEIILSEQDSLELFSSLFAVSQNLLTDRIAIGRILGQELSVKSTFKDLLSSEKALMSDDEAEEMLDAVMDAQQDK